MKMAIMDRDVRRKEKTNQDQGGEPQFRLASDRMISELFQAYFNNKMTLLVFLIQSKTFKPNAHLMEGVFRFLDDLYHHMLTHETQERCRYVLEGLKSFFHALPDVSQEERNQAKGFIRDLYHAMGINLKADI